MHGTGNGAPKLARGAMAILAVAAFTVALAGCAGEGEGKAPAPPGRTIPCMSAHGPEGLGVIRNQADWEAFWAKRCTGDPPTGAPALDFERHHVLYYFWGQKPTSGYSVSFGNVTEAGDSLHVEVIRTSSGTCPVTNAFTDPSAILQVPPSGKALEVSFTDKTKRC